MSEGPRIIVEPFQTDDSSRSGYAVIDENTGNIAIDYTQYYNRIATALETIATAATNDGIKTLGVYDWVLLSSVFKMYVDDTTKENFIGRDKLEEYRDKINSLPKG